MSKKVSYIFIILCIGLLQWALFFQGRVFTWDAAFYYASARSLVFDQDLKLSNDLQLSYPTATSDFEDKEYHNRFVQQERVYNPFAIGTSLTWVPWLRFVKLAYDLSGRPTHGFEWPYRIGAATISLVLGWAAFGLGFHIGEESAGMAQSLWATLTAMFATPLLYYIYFEPGYSHATSAFVTGLTILLWWRTHSTLSLLSGFTMGLMVGLAALVRWQHTVYLLLPLCSALQALRQAEWRWSRIRNYGLMLILAFLIGLSPQLVIWRLSEGKWLVVPQGESFMVWLPLYLPQLLFSTYRGILAWMPLFFPALLGLIMLVRRQPRQYLPLLLVLVAQVYVNASTPDWMGCGGYGPRRLSSELVIMIIGYSAVLRSLSRYSPSLPHVLNLGLIIHQLILFKFGLQEQLGGRAISKIADTYLIVEAMPWNEFVRQLFYRLSYLLHPETYLYPPSLLMEAVQGTLSWQQPIFSILLISFLVFLLGAVYRLYCQYLRNLRYVPIFLTVSITAFIFMLNLWLALRA